MRFERVDLDTAVDSAGESRRGGGREEEADRHCRRQGGEKGGVERSEGGVGRGKRGGEGEGGRGGREWPGGREGRRKGSGGDKLTVDANPGPWSWSKPFRPACRRS